MIGVIDQLIQATLLGGLYAMFALGLAISVGVLRFINVAHGDIIVMMSYLMLSLTQSLGLPAPIAFALLIPFGAVIGWLLQRTILERASSQNEMQIILITFGLSIVIQNGLLEAYGPDTRKLSGGALEIASVHVFEGLDLGVYPIAVFLTAVAVVAGLDAFLKHSSLGARIRAVADDPASADLIGLSSARIYPIAMGIVGVTVLISACAMAVWTNFDPAIGPSRLLAAFEAVVLGGLGSLWGTLAGGIVIGLAQNIGGQLDASWQALAQHLVFLVVLVVRPQGLFVKT